MPTHHPIPAAQYLRMSTEHQRYSIENQKAAIEEYAKQNYLRIVSTYVDAGKSGLDLVHRPGLRELLEHITSGHAEFLAVLVFDVSRWGRFQDSDEAAHYEFLCKSAGINIHYCAEPFSNDASLSSAVFKALKRAMAAEYSRELSAKTFAGQCRLARSGFKLGGHAGYGLRRLLLDSNNCPKFVLKAGERKSLTTERVSYALGPDEEVRVVREIYSLFLDQHLSVNAIVRLLNSKRISREIPGRWRRGVVQTILTHPKYAGCIVFNRTSNRLKSKRIFNPQDQWIVQPNCFSAIVSRDTFERAQVRLARGVARRTDEELLADLHGIVEAHGKLTIELIAASRDVASWATYRRRFGSVRRAFDLVLNCPERDPAATDNRNRTQALRMSVEQAFVSELAIANTKVEAHYPFLHFKRYGRVGLEIARCVITAGGDLRWNIKARKNGHRFPCIAIRLMPGNTEVRDYVWLHRVPMVNTGFQIREASVHRNAVVGRSVADVVRTMLASQTDANTWNHHG